MDILHRHIPGVQGSLRNENQNNKPMIRHANITLSIVETPYITYAYKSKLINNLRTHIKGYRRKAARYYSI